MPKNKFLAVVIIQLILIVILGVPCLLNTSKPVLFVTSDSMAPEIPAGSLIVIKHDPHAGLTSYVGRPFVFFDPVRKKHIVHRGLKVEGDFLVTRGDTNFFVDHLRVGREHILGSVIFKVTFFSRVIQPLLLLLLLLGSLMYLLRGGRPA